MKSKLWLLQLPILVIFTAAFLIYSAGIQGKLQNDLLRERVFPRLLSLAGQHTNLKFELRGPSVPKNKILIAEIDNDSIEEYGRWPWHRDRTAALVQSLFDSGAKFVALDITFSEPDHRVSEELAKFLKPKIGVKELDAFETDHQLETVITFNSGRTILGWFNGVECQPAFRGLNLEDCPVEAATQTPISKTLGKFALRDSAVLPPAALAQSPLVFVPTSLENLASYSHAAEHAGYLNADPDADGYIRRTRLAVVGRDGRFYPSLALATAAAVLGEDISVKLSPRHTIQELSFKNSGRKIPLSPLGMMDINFRGPANSFQYVKARELMSGEDLIRIEVDHAIKTVSKKELFRNSIVFVGLTALGVFDMRAFPFDSNTAGVEGHANILDNLLADDMLRTAPGSLGIIGILLLMTVGAAAFGFYVGKLESVPALIFFLVIMMAGFFIDQKILFKANYNQNTSLLMIELTALFIFTFAFKYILEEKNKKFIRGAFAKYVSPSIIDSIMKDPSKLSVGGVKRDLTIVFSDIRSFTSFSEKMDAKDLSTFLNDYLGRMTDIVFETEGTLDKYIGDAVMAFWGAPLDQPKHATNACKAAILMQQTLRKDRPYFKEKYGVDVTIGIGINSGPVSVGNMGSERIFEYTVIGDHVNLASRLEGLTKEYHAPILTTRFTFDIIESSGEILPPHRVLDFVKVKGKKIAVELIQILDREISAVTLKKFSDARALYTQREWDSAMREFEICANELSENGVPDAMSLEFITRCKNFKMSPPPPDWDGSWTMLTK
ncbi:MAG: adenylate/guanylate cyclase domain-containing protein [Cryobacterium sp.]|nr:adenylate/guanylate cyclase domain-containing protein [Oligoflexia bacterium]